MILLFDYRKMPNYMTQADAFAPACSRLLRESNPQLILRSKKFTQQIQKGSGFPYHLFENSLTYSLSYNVHQSHIQDQEFSFLSILEEETIMLGFQKEYLRCFIFTYLFITFIKCFVIIYS